MQTIKETRSQRYGQKGKSEKKSGSTRIKAPKVKYKHAAQQPKLFTLDHLLKRKHEAKIDLQNKRLPKRVKPRKHKYLLIVFSLLLCIFALVLTFNFFHFMRLDEDSMEPTLTQNSILLLRKSQDVKRGDIICFEVNGATLVRRVIALPNETVEINYAGRVYINGKVLEESYLTKNAREKGDCQYPYLVPRESVFVLADKRSECLDSRKRAIGSIPYTQIKGYVLKEFKIGK